MDFEEILEKMEYRQEVENRSNDRLIKLLNFKLSQFIEDFDRFSSVDSLCKCMEVEIKSIILSACITDEKMFNKLEKNFHSCVKHHMELIEDFKKIMKKHLKEESNQQSQ